MKLKSPGKCIHIKNMPKIIHPKLNFAFLPQTCSQSALTLIRLHNINCQLFEAGNWGNNFFFLFIPYPFQVVSPTWMLSPVFPVTLSALLQSHCFLALQGSQPPCCLSNAFPKKSANRIISLVIAS